MSWWRGLLNLPPKGQRWADASRPARASRDKVAVGQPTGPPPGYDPDWWQQPGVPAQAPPARPPAPRSPNGQPPPPKDRRHGRQRGRGDAPWVTEPESSFATWGRRFLRGLVVVVLLLAAISGVRSWIRPAASTAPPVSSEASYPRDESRAVAARFATAYLSWNEDRKELRPAAIGLDLAAGLDKSVGWNGKGKQTAGTAYPGEVVVDDGGVTARVDVRVLVIPSTKVGKVWTPGVSSWQRVSVPVAVTTGRVVVTGPPTYVPDDPAALPEDMPAAGATDDDLTSRTEKDAEAFFGAYATSNSAVAAVTAPGAAIASLNGAVKLDALRSWQVYAGNDDERSATAAVTWSGAGGTVLAQTYSVTLRRTVAADGAERWQVAALG